MCQAKPKNNNQQFSQRSVLYLLTHHRQNLARLNPRYSRPNECTLWEVLGRDYPNSLLLSPTWIQVVLPLVSPLPPPLHFWKVLPPAWETDALHIAHCTRSPSVGIVSHTGEDAPHHTSPCVAGPCTEFFHVVGGRC